jgi:hypothetical protein
MGLIGPCQACAAKDQTIAVLQDHIASMRAHWNVTEAFAQGQVKSLQHQVLSLTDRRAAADMVERETPRRPRVVVTAEGPQVLPWSASLIGDEHFNPPGEHDPEELARRATEPGVPTGARDEGAP